VTRNAAASSPRARRLLGVTSDQAIWFGAISLCAVAILYGLIPESAAFQIVGCTTIPLWWLIFRDGTQLQPFSAKVPLRLAAFGIWMALSALWAPRALSALHIALTFGLYVLCVEVWRYFLERPDTDLVRRRLGQALLLGFALVATIIAFEALTHLAGRSALATAFPSLRPGAHHMTLDAAGVVSVHPYMLNRSVAAVMFMTWPVFLIAQAVIPRAHRIAATAGLAGLTGLCVIAGQHGSSRLAFGASALMFVLATWRATIARRTALIAWTVLSLLVVPLAAAAYKVELFRWDVLPYSSAHRILIWGHTANDVLRRPLVGVGAAATRYIEQVEKPIIVRSSKFEFPVSVNSHAHNAYLQVWFELGAIGAFLFWVAGLPVITSIANASAAVRPTLYAAWATAATIASTSYSLTDPWFMASFCLLTVFSRLAVSLRA
jgi:O-antigen ligase